MNAVQNKSDPIFRNEPKDADLYFALIVEVMLISPGIYTAYAITLAISFGHESYLSSI